MSDLQTIIDRHAAATPGPHSVEVIDDHTGRPEGKNWLICDLARERYGRNSVSFGEDEKTALFVAAAFTDVPLLAARLQKVDELVTRMEDMIGCTIPDGADFEWYVSELRNALASLDSPK
jgi:hypothetical protein